MTAPRVTENQIDEFIEGATYSLLPDRTTTVCQLTLKNGFSTIGLAACVSPENYDVEIGKKISFADAKNKIWQLLGFQLKDKLQYLKDIKEPGEGITKLGETQIYLGTKAVYAVLMDRAAYNKLRGWELPADENGEDLGYLVQSPNEDANIAGFNGYISWLPKDNFEKVYNQIDYEAKPQSRVQRLAEELQQLIDRHSKLVSFISSDEFVHIASEEQIDLTAQRAVMESYIHILQNRITRA